MQLYQINVWYAELFSNKQDYKAVSRVMVKYYDMCIYDMSLDSLMVSSIMAHDVKTENPE
jgi:hypothetical protein